MINTKDLFELLKSKFVNCYCGVPDSLLKDFCAYITDHVDSNHHTITANEGNAIGLAAGHYLATGNIAVVYMQNSGLGNCVNPLLSLVDEDVYRIPLLMMIGWRGEPGKKDEPQHVKQGKVTDKLLQAMDIKYEVLSDNFEECKKQIISAFVYMKEENKPFAFIVKKGTFEPYSLVNKKENSFSLTREEAIETVVGYTKMSDVIVSTTGMISRELYETRERNGQSHKQDFLTVGSMGHSSSIALGIALEKPTRNVFCFDGDGSFLMHQGAITVVATKCLKNFKHIVFNNEAHDSVGGQPTAIYSENISQVALNCGYDKVYVAESKDELLKILPKFVSEKCTSLLEIKVKNGARSDLGRPKEKPVENKQLFVENLRQVDFVGRGSIDKLKRVLDDINPKKLLVFTGKKSFETYADSFKAILSTVENVTYYNKFSTNPDIKEVNTAISDLGMDFDLIISVGGGSVIDFAKAFRYLSELSVKMVAIPTTAGTGSESTQFAVVYEEEKKLSLDDLSILPEYSICDSEFLKTNSKYLKACTAMDAFCQAIESFWAVRSTPESRVYAEKAITLCKDNIELFVNSDKEDRESIEDFMMMASHMAGKAINISRTTAAHALSYYLTKRYGIPHGHAVALNIQRVYAINNQVTDTNCSDERGCSFVKDIMDRIGKILKSDNNNYFDSLITSIGLENFIGVSFEKLLSKVEKNRFANNPVSHFHNTFS